MTRDESTEGWLPLAGGGLANVSIRKRARLSPLASGHDYIIYGQRISDQSVSIIMLNNLQKKNLTILSLFLLSRLQVILSCVINRDLKYHKVMPTFHHWRAGTQRNGLTFQTAADARAFDKGVVRAYNELIDGMYTSTLCILYQSVLFTYSLVYGSFGQLIPFSCMPLLHSYTYSESVIDPRFLSLSSILHNTLSIVVLKSCWYLAPPFSSFSFPLENYHLQKFDFH